MLDAPRTDSLTSEVDCAKRIACGTRVLSLGRTASAALCGERRTAKIDCPLAVDRMAPDPLPFVHEPLAIPLALFGKALSAACAIKDVRRRRLVVVQFFS